MDCEEFDERPDDLVNLLNMFSENSDNISIDRIKECACLMCKNKTNDTSSRAIAIFEKLVSDDSYNALYWYGLAKICQSLSIFERSDEAYVKATRLAPYEITYFESAARYFCNTIQMDRLLYYCNQLIGLDINKQKRCNYLMGKTYFNLGMYDKALLCFEQGVENQANDYFIMKLQCYYYMGKNDIVVEMAENILNDKIDDKTKILSILSKAYFALRFFDKAVIIFEDLVKINRDEYIQDLAATYSNLNRFNDAIELYEEIVRKVEYNELVFSNYALTLYKHNRKDNLNKVINLYLDIVHNNPNSLTVCENLGEIYFENAQYKEAIKYLKKGYDLDNSKISTLRKAIISAITDGDYDTGILLSQQIISRNLASSVDFCNIGWCYKQNRKFKEAAHYVYSAIDKDPGNSLYLSIFAEILFLQRDYTSSISYFRKALEIDKGDPYLWDSYGNTLLALKKYDEAIEVYKKAISLNEKNTGVAINQLGWAYYENNDYDNAIPCFLEAIQKSIELGFEDVSKYKNNLLLSYVSKHDYLGLIALLEDKYELFSDPFSNLIIGIIYMQLGEVKKGEEHFNKISSDLFTNEYINIMKAFAIFNSNELGKYEKVIDMFSKVDLEGSNNILFREDMFRCIGESYLASKNDDALSKAIDSFSKAVEIGTSNAFNWYDLGVSYLKNGNYDEASSAFQTAWDCKNSSECLYLKLVYDIGKKLSPKEKCLAIKYTFATSQSIERIKSALKYNSNKPVYHYTKLTTLKELIKTDCESGKYPKLRMSNSAHMNDPLEGSIFDKLIDSSFKNSNCEVLKSSGVFLLSLCETGDSLPLWIQYGDNGEGCSIEIDANFFDKSDNIFLKNIFKQQGNNSTKNTLGSYILSQITDAKQFYETQKNINNIDIDSDLIRPIFSLIDNLISDNLLVQNLQLFEKIMSINNQENKREKYCLYRVCYINEDKNFVNITSESSKIINTEIANVNELLNNLKKDSLIDDNSKILVWNIINEILGQIRFLFKSSDYKHEQEVRIIKYESIHSDSVKRNEFAENFPSLFIEIERQLHFSKVILGPRVDRPSKIIPAMYKGKIVDKVVLSKIKYQ